MIINHSSNAFVHALRGFFFVAPPGTYHPSAVRRELGLDTDQWRALAKSQLYPEHSLGRLALSSVNTEIVVSTRAKTPSEIALYDNDDPVRLSVFEKHPKVPVDPTPSWADD